MFPSKMNDLTLAEKILCSHLAVGDLDSSDVIGLRIDQALLQDATGTLVMLELESLGIKKAGPLTVQYIDHNLLQTDYKNPDDHLFLESAAKRFGIYISPPGNGISHVVHQQSFGKPGETLIGSDSHTPAAGALAMLGFGAGGIDVAAVIAGQPYELHNQKIWGIYLDNELPEWVSAKDVVLELLRRHSVSGGKGKIIEYFGPGLKSLSVMDRHVIANMGTELGATSSVFPSDDKVLDYLKLQGREKDYKRLMADKNAEYDELSELDLSKLEPLIAMPSSPDNVHPVSTASGQKIYQAYIGSSANPGFRDFAIAAKIVRGHKIPNHVSFDINVSSRQTLMQLIESGDLLDLVNAGARIHQIGCNGCIGMGQAPATNEISLRTVPRNFPGRSGTKEDKVCLVSPATAATSALMGRITDPRTLDMDYPEITEPIPKLKSQEMIGKLEYSPHTQLRLGPNIERLHTYDPLPNHLSTLVLLKLGANVSTDEILPAGSRVLPYRSNIDKISAFAFIDLAPGYAKRAKQLSEGAKPHIIIAAENYGQGSSREHAALVVRHLGAACVIAKSFARIHYANLINYGVFPLTFSSEEDYENLQELDQIKFENLIDQITNRDEIIAHWGDLRVLRFKNDLNQTERRRILSGGLLNLIKDLNPKETLNYSSSPTIGKIRP